MVQNRIKKIINIGFIAAILLVICYGTFHAHVFQFEISIFENRLAYMMPNFNLTSFFNKSFQDNVELAYSDQLPLANYMKKWYQYTNNYTFDKVAYDLFKDNCSNKYIRVDNILSHYDCQNGNFYNLVYNIERVNIAKTSFDNRIANINELISGGN